MLFNTAATELFLETARRAKHMTGENILFPIFHTTKLG
jgi:hypothetical protein